MRTGSNPFLGEDNVKIESYHRVVVPVFIPNTEQSYYKDSFKILKYCLRSILKTIHNQSRLTVYNNGSCLEVQSYLEDLKSKEVRFDQLFNSSTNVGKINAINTCVRGNLEEFFTVTDADVLFKNNWQEAVEDIFYHFPRAGMVSPVPVSNMYKFSEASSTLGYGILTNKITFNNVIDKDDLLKFQQSVGSELFKGERLNKFICLKEKKEVAVISCGHFVSTLRKEVFQNTPSFPSKDFISTKSDLLYIDKPNNNLGFLRLATLKNYAFHLGNTPEKWMGEYFENLTKNNSDGQLIENIPVARQFSELQCVR